MVWREGFELLISKPRHLVFGVGARLDQRLLAAVGIVRQWPATDRTHALKPVADRARTWCAGTDSLADLDRCLCSHALETHP